jgi:endonuclease/exonuclease/phosphatase family metal-dependent hydrolase
MKDSLGLIVLIPVVLCVLFFLWASYPWHLHPHTLEGETHKTTSTSSQAASYPTGSLRPSTLNILTWNMSYAHGRGSGGVGYQKKSKEEYLQTLASMATVIKESGADIVFLQECDFSSSRTYHINQAETLATLTGLPYTAQSSSWEANYIPFPGLNPFMHFGKMNSGGAILSRFPLTPGKTYLLEKPQSKSWAYNLFYLYRYIQTSTLHVGGLKLTLANIHLEAFDPLTKKNQAQFLKELSAKENLDFVAGDFNTVPVLALNKTHFSDSTDNYDKEEKVYLALKESGYLDAVTEVNYSLNEKMWHTFPSWSPNRKLDYVWAKPQWSLIKSEVLNVAGVLSDHLPLKAVYHLQDPIFLKD